MFKGVPKRDRIYFLFFLYFHLIRKVVQACAMLAPIRIPQMLANTIRGKRIISLIRLISLVRSPGNSRQHKEHARKRAAISP